MATPQVYDLIVIGAGLHGLVAAKTYIQLHPNELVLVVEAESTCGGTWSQQRLYPGLRANNSLGYYELPDFPMSGAVYGVKEGETIPAPVVHRYLRDYADKFGVLERTRFDTKVDALEARDDESWCLYVSPSEEAAASASASSTAAASSSSSSSSPPPPPQTRALFAKKVIVATGVTSTPNMPQFTGQESFTGALFHVKNYLRHHQATQSAKRAVVIGGGKSAHDAAFALAKQDAQAEVHIIIRPTGRGPIWMLPRVSPPILRMSELPPIARFPSCFSPCPWVPDDGSRLFRSFLHGTVLGRLLVKGFWALVDSQITTAMQYNDDANLFKLKPWESIAWYGTAIGNDNFSSNFYDLVRQGKITVHIADVTKLDGSTVHLSDKQTLNNVDVLLCATGWEKDPPMRRINFDPDLSLPLHTRQSMRADADASLLSSFPGIKDQPVMRGASKDTTTNILLHRFMVPPDHFHRRNIAYAGLLSSFSTACCSAAQALWISAFFDGKLLHEPDSLNDMYREVMLHTRFCRWRFPCSFGSELPEISFETVPYIDLLLKDMGLNFLRKKTRFSEIMQSYRPSDYDGLVDEWKQEYMRAETEKNKVE